MTMNAVTLWQILSGIAIVLTALGGFGLWVLRLVIRQELEPVKEDVHVLKVAAFNHLTHGETPDENAIRIRLGYSARPSETIKS